MQANDEFKLKRNKSLIEIKKEKWNRERDELKDSESWYSKFDSLKKKPAIDRSRSEPNIYKANNYEDNPFNRFESVSRLFSPVSNFDNESIALTNNSYTAPQSPFSSNQLDNQLNNQFENSKLANQSPNEFTTNEANQPRTSFRRYAHQFNNVNTLEKRRKQQEYHAQLEAQIAQKREQTKLEKHHEALEDRKLEQKIRYDQVELRNQFQMDHGEQFNYGTAKNKDELRMKKERKSINDLHKLELKSKELIKVFKEASTQTDQIEREVIRKESRKEMYSPKQNTSTQKNELNNKTWQTSILQPVKTNRSVVLRNSNSKPKWTKQNLKGNLKF